MALMPGGMKAAMQHSEEHKDDESGGAPQSGATFSSDNPLRSAPSSPNPKRDDALPEAMAHLELESNENGGTARLRDQLASPSIKKSHRTLIHRFSTAGSFRVRRRPRSAPLSLAPAQWG